MVDFVHDNGADTCVGTSQTVRCAKRACVRSASTVLFPFFFFYFHKLQVVSIEKRCVSCAVSLSLFFFFLFSSEEDGVECSENSIIATLIFFFSFHRLDLCSMTDRILELQEYLVIICFTVFFFSFPIYTGTYIYTHFFLRVVLLFFFFFRCPFASEFLLSLISTVTPPIRAHW